MTTTNTLPAGIIKKVTDYNIDPKRITRREGWNARFDFGDIKTLAGSIKEELARDPSSGGLLNPIRVKRLPASDPRAAAHDFEIIDGDRRLTAIELLLGEGVVFPQGVPAKLVDRNTDDVTNLIHMYTANTGKAFLPLEEAAAFKRMKDAGMTVAAIASRVGRDQVHVRETLALLDADEAVKEAVKGKKVGGSAARLIATIAKGDAALQKELVADAAAAKGKSADAKAAKARFALKIQKQRDAKNAAKGKEVKMRALTDAQLAELGAGVAKVLEAKVKEAGWKAFTTLEDLTTMIAKDEKLAAAFTVGAQLALRAAAGVKDINLDI